MTSIKINNSEIGELLKEESPEFPLYTAYLINQASRTAQATRPKIVGQMSELVPQFRRESNDKSFNAWKIWYLAKYPNAIDEATDKAYNKLMDFKDAFKLIDKNMTRSWIEDLLLTKTYSGLCFQEVIIMKVAELKNLPYRFANTEDESKGIDGYIGDMPISVKPNSYKTKDMVVEKIDANIIYYNKNKTNISIEFDF